MTVLLGRTSAGSDTDFSTTGLTAAWPFVASATGTLAFIYAQTKTINTGSGHRLGIYANSGGVPGARLAVATVTIGTPTGTGIFGADVSASAVSIVSGTTYHLAWYQTGDNFDFAGTAGGAYRETNAVADFPDPFGASSGSTTDAIIWGEDVGTTYPTITNDFQRTRFPFLIGDSRMQGVPRAGARRRTGGLPGPSPIGGFERYIFPRLHPVFAGGAAQFLDITAATETDTAVAFDIDKYKTLGVSLETDAAQALDKDKIKVLGVAAEADTAQALDKDKRITISFASEADAAQALTKFKSKLLGVATESDVAQALNIDKIKVLIPATETDAAQLISFSQGSVQSITITAATESDVAQALTKYKSKALGAATETDAAQALTKSKRVTIIAAVETDAAQALAHLKRLGIAAAMETDAAQALTKYKSKTLGAAAETDAARPLVFTKTIYKNITHAQEFDVAVPLSIAGSTVVVVYRYRGPIVIGRF